MRILRFALLLVLALPFGARADEDFYWIEADDGMVVNNHRVPADTDSKIEHLPGIVIVGNPRGRVTLTEFYDVNCPFCRMASPNMEQLLKRNADLRLILVPFPVLGIPSIQAARVELAVAQLASPDRFYRFHRMLDDSHGTVDGSRALQAAKAIGLDEEKVLAIANEDRLADVMTAHMCLGDGLAIKGTPGFVIKGVAFAGYPGPKAMAKLVASVERCGAVMCEDQ
jgi:protein-disulfide isomerase